MAASVWGVATLARSMTTFVGIMLATFTGGMATVARGMTTLAGGMITLAEGITTLAGGMIAFP